MRNILSVLLASVLLFGCAQDPKKILVPEKFENTQQLQEFAEKLKDLPKEERDLLSQYMFNWDTTSKRTPGTTVGEAIEIQRKANEEKKRLEEEKKLKEAQEKAKIEKIKQELKQTLTVTVTDKFIEDGDSANFDFNRYSNTFIVLQNNSKKTITGIKGKLVFTNNFGDIIKVITMSNDNMNIAPSDTEEMPHRESIIGSLDTKYYETDLNNLKYEFEAEQIIFADGSKIVLEPSNNDSFPYLR